MVAIGRIAAEAGIPVIEDAAQAHGATWNGTRVGTLGKVACFSFYPGKNLGACGDAGAATTDDVVVAEQIRLWRNHGRHAKYLHEQLGLGERLDTLQAAILRVKLSYLDAWTTSRRRLAARYDEQLADTELILPSVAEPADPVWHLYVVRSSHRDELHAYLREHGVGAGIHYPIPLHLQPAYAAAGCRRGDLPVTEAIADSCLSLPLYPEMTPSQQDRVVSVIKAFPAGGTRTQL
jgi:dTDP-4-amino-4,6-dideoxygalactose transaminase